MRFAKLFALIFTALCFRLEFGSIFLRRFHAFLLFEIDIFYCLYPFFPTGFREGGEEFVSYKVIISFLVLIVKVLAFLALTRYIFFYSFLYPLGICFLGIPVRRPVKRL